MGDLSICQVPLARVVAFVPARAGVLWSLDKKAIRKRLMGFAHELARRDLRAGQET